MKIGGLRDGNLRTDLLLTITTLLDLFILTHHDWIYHIFRYLSTSQYLFLHLAETVVFCITCNFV